LVDPEHLMLLEVTVDHAVQRDCRCQILPEGLFHDQTGPPLGVGLLPAQSGPAQHAGHRSVQRRRQGQVKNAVAAGVVALVDLLQQPGQPFV
jgi:hypothetical protein